MKWVLSRHSFIEINILHVLPLIMSERYKFVKISSNQSI